MPVLLKLSSSVVALHVTAVGTMIHHNKMVDPLRKSEIQVRFGVMPIEREPFCNIIASARRRSTIRVLSVRLYMQPLGFPLSAVAGHAPMTVAGGTDIYVCSIMEERRTFYTVVPHARHSCLFSPHDTFPFRIYSD